MLIAHVQRIFVEAAHTATTYDRNIISLLGTAEASAPLKGKPNVTDLRFDI